jgi:hypothetical protein
MSEFKNPLICLSERDRLVNFIVDAHDTIFFQGILPIFNLIVVQRAEPNRIA